MKPVKNQSNHLSAMSGAIVALTVVTFAVLLIPVFNPVRFLPRLKDWSYLYFIGHSLEVDKLFNADFKGVRELFANNAVIIFCGFIVGAFVTAQLISALLTLSKKPKLKSYGLMFLMIFSALNFFANLIIIAAVFNANSKVAALGYTPLGIHYLIPAGSAVFIALGAAQFVLGRLYRKRLLIVKGLYRRMTHKEKLENIKGYAFISPYIVGFICFTGLPLIFSFFSAFTYYNITSVQKWFGFNNFVQMFTTDPNYWKSLYNTVWYVIVSVPIAIAVALLLALLMNMSQIKGLRFFRTVYYLPSVLSGVAVFLLWQWVLDPNAGLLNSFLSIFGVHGPAWLYDAQWTKPALVIMKVWGAGGNIIIFLAALQAVPQELYEASAIDGATGIKRFFYVTVPMISPTLFFVMVTGVSGAFQVFDSAYIMANGTGGPENSLLFYNLNLFNTAMASQAMGKASAMAWVLFIIIMVFTIIQMYGSKKWVYYEGGSSKK